MLRSSSASRAFIVLSGALVLLGFFARPALAVTLPDPPAFGLVNLVPGESIRINVVCSLHGVGKAVPSTCTGDLMLHDADGNLLGSQTVTLAPGKSTSLAFDARAAAVGIEPCWMPASGSSRAIPSVEVFGTTSGQTTLFINPAVGHLSDLTAVRGR